MVQLVLRADAEVTHSESEGTLSDDDDDDPLLRRRASTEPMGLAPAVLKLDKRSRPSSSLMSRRGSFISVSLPEPPKSCWMALVEQGYLLGGVLGRSSANRGFTVFALEKDGRRLAAKGTAEPSADGILAATLKGEFLTLRASPPAHPETMLRRVALIRDV